MTILIILCLFGFKLASAINHSISNPHSQINILSFSDAQPIIANAYKELLIGYLNDMLKNYSFLKNRTNIEGKIVKCINETEELYTLNSSIFYRMLISSGVQRNEFGDYSECMAINTKTDDDRASIYKNTSLVKYVIIEGINIEDYQEKVLFGTCVPMSYSDIIKEIESEYIKINSKMYRVLGFPRRPNSIKKNLSGCVWIYIIIGYICSVILLNIVMSHICDHINPYHSLLNSVIFKKNLTYVEGGQDNLNTHLIDRHSFNVKADSYIELKDLNWFKRIYYNYFSIGNNYYLISTVTSTNFNDKWGLGIGDWGLGIGDWGLGPIPNPQSPIPNPQSPIPNPQSQKYKEKFFTQKKDVCLKR